MAAMVSLALYSGSAFFARTVCTLPFPFKLVRATINNGQAARILLCMPACTEPVCNLHRTGWLEVQAWQV